MIKNKAWAMIISSLWVVPVSAGYDAFQDKLQRPSESQQSVDRTDQPTSPTLQSSDIKEYRDKLTMIQTQMFKDGTVPKGSSLQADDPKKPDTFRIQAPFGQLTKSAQNQIVTQLPEAKTLATPLLMTVVLDKGNIHINSVQPAPSAEVAAKSSLSSSVPKISVAHNTAVAPNSVPARVNVPSFRSAHAAETTTPNSKASQPAVKMAAAETGHPSTTMPLPNAARFFLGQDAAAVQVMDNPVRISHDSLTQAMLPTNGQDPIVVRQVELLPTSMGVKVTMTMPAAAVPAVLVERLTEDKPEGLAIVSSEKNVEMSVALMPDGSFAITSVRPMGAPAQATSTDASLPSEVRALLTELDIAAPNVPKAASVSNAGFLKGVQQLASVLAINPASIVFETPTADASITPVGPLALVTHSNGNVVLIQGIKLATGENAYLAQGRLSNVSNTLQAEVKSRLETSGNANFLSGNPELIIESQADAENGFNVLMIAAAPTEKSKAAIVLWEAPAVVPATQKTNGVVRTQPMQLVGLAPASRAVIKTVFGEKAGQASFEGVQEVPTVHFVSGSNANLSLRWSATDRSDRQSFLYVGKPLEFTDAIRDAVKNELGAEKPKKDSTDIQVEFLVDQTQTAPTVKVVEAGPSPRDVAEKQAESMGLSPRDYLLVDIGSRFLIVVDKGQSFLIPGSPPNVRLKSSDGNLTIVGRPRLMKNEGNTLLIISRASIKANWANLVRLSGGNIDETVDKALRENPRSDQFLVRLNPSQAPAFIVRPLNPSTAALFKPGTPKP